MMKGFFLTEIADYHDYIEQWRRERLTGLKQKGGWLSLVGRWPLEAGTVSIGSSDENDIVLPAGPGKLGALTLVEGKGLTFSHEGGSEQRFIPADSRFPVVFPVDRFNFEVTSMSGALALRVRDLESDEPEKLEALPYFPADPSWRIRAEWVALAEPGEVTLDTVIGVKTLVPVSHVARFDHDGKTVELLSTYGTAERPQFVFRDSTAKDETYAAARFVFGEEVTDDAITLDFNKAINPPCAFTEFAACPLPPEQNILSFPVRAGEKRVRS